MKWVPSLFTLLLSAIGIYHDQVLAFIMAHPQAVVIIGGVYSLAKGLMPSPLSNGSPVPEQAQKSMAAGQ